MIVRITETVYSEFSGVYKREPVLYKIPGELQQMVDDIHKMSRDSLVKADIFSTELTDSDNLPCNNPFRNSLSCNKEESDGCDTGTSDWLERQIGFVKANHLENCLMKNDGDLKMEPEHPNLCTIVIYDQRLPAIGCKNL